LKHQSILQHWCIFKFFQFFSTCLLTFPCFVCMCQLLQDGQREFSQTYGLIALNSSEEEEEIAAAEVAMAAAASATAKAVKEAATASGCCCKPEQ
jgi:hypothetical protein